MMPAGIVWAYGMFFFVFIFYYSLIPLVIHSDSLNFHHHCHHHLTAVLIAQTMPAGIVWAYGTFYLFYYSLIPLLIHSNSLNFHHHCCHCLTAISMAQTMPAGIIWAYGTFFFVCLLIHYVTAFLSLHYHCLHHCLHCINSPNDAFCIVWAYGMFFFFFFFFHPLIYYCNSFSLNFHHQSLHCKVWTAQTMLWHCLGLWYVYLSSLVCFRLLMWPFITVLLSHLPPPSPTSNHTSYLYFTPSANHKPQKRCQRPVWPCLTRDPLDCPPKCPPKARTRKCAISSLEKDGSKKTKQDEEAEEQPQKGKGGRR